MISLEMVFQLAIYAIAITYGLSVMNLHKAISFNNWI